jgi:hypothetical protein
MRGRTVRPAASTFPRPGNSSGSFPKKQSHLHILCIDTKLAVDTITHVTQPTTQARKRIVERGQEINGGKFVGKTKKSSEWVWYPGSDRTFEEMCQTFDQVYGTK